MPSSPAPDPLLPMFAPVSLSLVGFSQDADYIYIPVSALVSSSAGSGFSDNQIFYLLMLKLQAAGLAAHQVTGSTTSLVIESRALVNSALIPDNY